MTPDLPIIPSSKVKNKTLSDTKIPLTGNNILDSFLNLPNEALAELQCEIT